MAQDFAIGGFVLDAPPALPRVFGRMFGIGDPHGQGALSLSRRVFGNKEESAPVSAPNTALQPGAPDDGGAYVGLSAEDGKPLHAALADEPEYLSYDGALTAADRLKSFGFARWPVKTNLNVPSNMQRPGAVYRFSDRGSAVIRIAALAELASASPTATHRTAR